MEALPKVSAAMPKPRLRITSANWLWPPRIWQRRFPESKYKLTSSILRASGTPNSQTHNLWKVSRQHRKFHEIEFLISCPSSKSTSSFAATSGHRETRGDAATPAVRQSCRNYSSRNSRNAALKLKYGPTSQAV